MNGLERFINDETVQKLADSLGVAAEFIWIAFQRQVLVDAIAFTIAALGAIVVLVKYTGPVVRASNRDREPYFIVLLFPGGPGVFFFYQALLHWLNPNYVILQMIGDLVK